MCQNFNSDPSNVDLWWGQSSSAGTIIDGEIDDSGFVLLPGILYLGVTIEYTETHNAVPFLEGKSSIGRLGIDIHATAGKGDVGYCNTWTLEISCVQPVRIYAGMPIGQLIYFKLDGDVERTYYSKKNAKYTKSDQSIPFNTFISRQSDQQ